MNRLSIIFFFNLTNVNNAKMNSSLFKSNSTTNVESIIYATIFIIIFLFGIFTNIIVIVVYLFNSRLKKHTCYVFANLSLADLLVLIVCIPVALTDLFSPDEWHFGLIYCNIFLLLNFFLFLELIKYILKAKCIILLNIALL